MNYLPLLKGLAVLGLVFVAFSTRSTQAKAKRYDRTDPSKAGELTRLGGKVQSIRRGDGKLFLEIEGSRGSHFWVGTGDRPIEAGALVSFELTVPERDYQIRSLGLTLPEVYFTPYLTIEAGSTLQVT